MKKKKITNPTAKTNYLNLKKKEKKPRKGANFTYITLKNGTERKKKKKRYKKKK